MLNIANAMDRTGNMILPVRELLFKIIFISKIAFTAITKISKSLIIKPPY